MKIFDAYLLKNLAIATLFVAVVLVFITFLTQSLRFLEIVINAGSSGSAFLILTGLALPRFFEVILPLSLMASTLFIYHKMTMDSELIAIRAIGHSPIAMAKPAMALGLIVTVILWCITMWIAPISMSKMQTMRNELKSEFSTLLFKEGIFNPIGDGLTVYIHKRNPSGELSGLMIHDTRDKDKPPSTVLAKRGIIIADEKGHQVLVFDGSQQEYNPQSGRLQKLTFKQYTIELPENDPVSQRWIEPDERTILELLSPDHTDKRDLENLRQFSIEIHRRITSPILAFAFPLIVLATLLVGPIDRRGQALRISLAIFVVILIQGLFITSYNFARNHDTGLIMMYACTLFPIIVCLTFISHFGEKFRRQILYTKKLIP